MPEHVGFRFNRVTIRHTEHIISGSIVGYEN